MDFKRRENENEQQFIWRIGRAYDDGLLDMDWDEIGELINKEFRSDETEYRTSSAYRKIYQYSRKMWEAGVFNQMDEDSYIQELRDAKHEVRKEKQKLWDERVALNRILREQARSESMYDVMKTAIEEYVPLKFHYESHKKQDGENDLIIHLTDLHCGMDITSVFNTFNLDILQKRLSNYLDSIIEIKELYQAQNAYVIIGGDMVQGLIHVNTRIESKENVVQQIMCVSDLVSNFLFQLSKIFDYVEVHTTAGNHARSSPDKEDTPHGENFDLLIPFVCSKELKEIQNVCFKENVLDYDIATFSVRGHTVYATHGDKDSVKNVVYHMTQFARKAKLPLPDLCYLGHRHTNGLTTVDDVKVIESGCIDGMDTYAINQRLIGTPEQTVTVISERHRIKALCDVQVD